MQLRPIREVPIPPPSHPRGRPGGRVRGRPGAGRLVAAAALALLVIAAAGYAAWWYTAAGRVRSEALKWIAGQEAQGWHITHGVTARAGFPLALGVRFADPAVEPTGGGGSWRAREVLLSAPVFGPRALRLAVAGEQRLRLGSGAEALELTGRAETFAFDFAPSASWLPNGTLGVRRMSFDAEGGAPAGIDSLDLVSAGDPAAASGPEASGYQLRLSAQGIRLPPSLATPVGNDVSRLLLDAQIQGALKPRPWPAALARWRDEGGTIEVTRLVVEGGSVVIDGDGTLALDKRGQPIGAMSVRLQGYEALLDRLAAEKAIPPHVAATGRILLRGLARAGSGNGEALTAPLTLQDRALTIGPVQILRVPEVRWLEGQAGR